MSSTDIVSSEMLADDPAKLRHDIKSAITSLQLIGELIEAGYRFDDESSDEIKKKYKESVELLRTFVS